MFAPVQFEPEMESLVRFVEETEPDRIVPETLSRLRAGTPPRTLLTASALAVVRSTELPAGHHGGAVHPISALHGCYHTAQRLPGELAFVPIIQHVALSNHHTRSRHMGPYVMAKLEPMDGTHDRAYQTYLDVESSIVHMGAKVRREDARDLRTLTSEAMLSHIASERPVAAEQYCLWLLERLSPGEVYELLMPEFINRNHLDDHNVIYPVLTARALDCIGWEWAPVLMRPVVRYQARHARDISGGQSFDSGVLARTIETHRLLEIDIPEASSQAETERVGRLGEEIGANCDCFSHMESIARALTEGLSLAGAGEALSIGASTVFTRSTYGNPMDSHLHTGVNVRRYLLAMPGMSRETRLLALLSGLTGPECTQSLTAMNWVPAVDPGALAALPGYERDPLLDAITSAIEGQPRLDWSQSERLDRLVIQSDARHVMTLAQQYVDRGFEPTLLLDRLAGLVCRDDFTELHSVKHHQAIVDEFHGTRAEFRSVHLLAAAKSAAVIHAGLEQQIYAEVRELIEA